MRQTVKPHDRWGGKQIRPFFSVLIILSLLLLPSFILMGPAWAPQALADPIDPSLAPDPEAQKLVHKANHAVESAWEAFHQAALGGTLVSPAVQSQIEQDLREARTLLVQAQDAADQGRGDDLQALLQQITDLTTRIVKASQEPKP